MLYDSTMLDIGSDKQVFVDDLLLESVENMSREWHQPVRVEACLEKPLLTRDQPWEPALELGCNGWQIIRDPKDGLFKCWYCSYKKAFVVPGQAALEGSVFNILYAESEDGIHWRKPLFDLARENGAPTNIVIRNGYDPGVLFDPLEEDDSKRFKIIHSQFAASRDIEPLGAATSADGIHWTPTAQPPVFGRSGPYLDDVIILSRDPNSRVYLMNTRHFDMYAVARNLKNPVVGHFIPPNYPLDWRRLNKRRIWQAESADFLHWCDPYPVLGPEDGQDDLEEAYYGLCQFPLGDVKLGFLNILQQTANTFYVRLVYSRDGKTWQQLNKRRPFMSPRGAGHWDAYMLTMPNKPIPVGDELYIYHDGFKTHHDWYITGCREGLDVPEANDPNMPDSSIGLAKLRLDGFVSLKAGPARTGIVITRPFISYGSKLEVNARCLPGGSIAAEAVDIHDDVLPGFSRQECNVFTGDSVRHTFTWKGRSEIPVLSKTKPPYPEPEIGRFRKIRFYMDKAELYSFRLV